MLDPKDREDLELCIAAWKEVLAQTITTSGRLVVATYIKHLEKKLQEGQTHEPKSRRRSTNQ